MVERDPGQRGEECCDEIHETDGRDDDGEDHKGDWGSHAGADQIHNQQEECYINLGG